MLSRIRLLLTIFIIFINVGNISSVCIPGDNCPYGSGVCKLDVCECLPGYQTFITSDNTNPIYCNYKQTSRWIPFILELFLPTIGLFYLGRYFHAIIKLLLFIPLICGGKDVSLIWFLFFFFLYVTDLICLFFCIYSDGNGFALV